MGVNGSLGRFNNRIKGILFLSVLVEKGKISALRRLTRFWNIKQGILKKHFISGPRPNESYNIIYLFTFPVFIKGISLRRRSVISVN